MDTTIVLFVISGLLGVINVLLGLGFKNMKEEIKSANDKADKNQEKVNALEVEMAETKTNYVERFSEIKDVIHSVEKNILAQINKKTVRA